MFRATTATLLCVTLSIVVQTALAQPTKSRDLGLLGVDSEDSFEDEIILDGEQQRTNLGKLSSVTLLIKNQFKEIIQDIGLQVLQYVLYVFQQLKVKLLTKFGLYTLSDILQAIFDGVTNFVADSPSDTFYYPERVKTTSEPTTAFLNSYWPLLRSNQ